MVDVAFDCTVVLRYREGLQPVAVTISIVEPPNPTSQTEVFFPASTTAKRALDSLPMGVKTTETRGPIDFVRGASRGVTINIGEELDRLPRFETV